MFTQFLPIFRCHIWIKLFPPVPAPKSNIKDLLVVTDYEVMFKDT